MNYEELYADLQPLEKDLKEVVNLISRMYKNIIKDTEGGNLRNISKSLETLQESVGTLSERTEAIRETVDAFDTQKYFESGDFTEQMLSCCEEQEIDVIGQSPVFEMFPYRVRIDAENQDVYLDRKKMNTMRPVAVAQTIGKSQEKMLKARFNEKRFLEELSEAYDTTVLKLGKRPGIAVSLKNIYKTLVPMGRFRRDYDEHNFAFDIAKLNEAQSQGLVERTKKGRPWKFGHSKENKNAIRILNASGNEEFIATLTFFDEDQ